PLLKRRRRDEQWEQKVLRVEPGGDPAGARLLAHLVLLFAHRRRGARSRNGGCWWRPHATAPLLHGGCGRAARRRLLLHLQTEKYGMRSRRRVRDPRESRAAPDRAVARRHRHGSASDHRRVEQLGHLLDAVSIERKGVIAMKRNRLNAIVYVLLILALLA